MYLYIKIHQRARKKTNLIFRNTYFMCIISSQKSEMFLEGRERNISTLKLEIPGSNLMCKWVQWGWGAKCGEPKKRHLKIWDFYSHELITLTTSPPSTFISCFKFWCNRLVLDLHFSSPKRSTRNNKNKNQQLSHAGYFPFLTLHPHMQDKVLFPYFSLFPGTTTHFWYPLTLQKPQTILLPWQNSERLSEKQPAFEISAGKSRPRKPQFLICCTQQLCI